VQPTAVFSAVERLFVEQNERPQDRINFNDSTTIEPAQRRGALERAGVGNPRRQDRLLFRCRQLLSVVTSLG